MVGALFDTNILIDHLRGIEAARDELARYTDKAISLITWMEVLVGTSEPHRPGTRAFLDSFTRIEIDPRVAERAVALRRDLLKLDAHSDAYRLIFSDSDGLAGLTVDRYDATLSIEVTTLGVWLAVRVTVSGLLPLALSSKAASAVSA